MLALGHILAEGVSTVNVESRLELARWSSGNALLIGGLTSAIGLYAVWWMYRREARGRVSKWLRGMMVTLRVIALVLLGLIGLEPVFVKYEHRRVDAQTLVLVDDSASMSLADQYRDSTEATRAERAIGSIPTEGIVRSSLAGKLLSRDDSALLKNLAASNDVRLFSFSDSLTFQGLLPRTVSPQSVFSGNENSNAPAEARMPEGAIRLESSGAATNLSQAIRGAMDSAAGAPVAGVVLLSDGGFNRGESVAIISRLLEQTRTPLFAVGIGDPAEPVNVRVVQLSAARSAFKNDPFSVTVRLASRGAAEQEIKIELLEQLEGKSREVVESRTVRAGASGEIAPVAFERKIKTPGVARYVACVSPLAYEAVLSDNEKELSPAVRILDDQMKVLLIAGAPSYDYRFLARMFERDTTVELSTWLQSADSKAVRDGDKVITALPATLEELNTYDAIILMDCDPAEFDPTWGSVISTYVSDYGGGLLVAAGNKYTGRFLKNEGLRSLVEVLPIAPDPEAELVINELGHYQTRPWPIFIPDDAVGDAILQQSDSVEETRAIWAALGGVYWHYPVRREKPVAHVLMRHTNPRMANAFGQHVLLATQYVGTGRTAWLGINSTWRWRRSNERHFNRFWIQTLRFLVEGKLLGGRARGQILTSKDEFELGETVVVTVRALDERFNPLLVPELGLQISQSAGKGPSKNARTIDLTPISGREGYFEGRFVPPEIGALRLSVQLPGSVGGKEAEAGRTLEKEIDITQSDIEMRNTALNRAALQELVAGAGGPSAYFNIDEVETLPRIVPDMGRTFVVRGKPRPVWDNGTVLAVIVGLLTIEWILRKKARLL